MLVIPVLDIKGGVVVHATGGDRARYAPIETPLAPGRCDPVSVALGYRALYPFPVMYVADLDAIAGAAPNLAAVRAMSDALPDVHFWIDDGQKSGDAGDRAAQPNGAARLHDVLGSETMGSVAELRPSPRIGRPARLLSLDFRGDDFLGPPELLARADLWPETVIVMTLARVGSGAGPDVQRLSDIIARADGRRVIAAGGVRHAADLEALAGIGVAGALVATALHSGNTKASDLERVAGL